MYARAAAWLILTVLLSCAPTPTENRGAPSGGPSVEPVATATAATDAPAVDASAEANVVANPRHKLSCLFLEDADGAEYVVLRDDATGRRARYYPTRQPDRAAETVEKYHREVWSHDGEYLALPQNPFDGFCVIKAKGALQTISRRRCDDFIRVLDYRPQMEVRKVAFHHEWGKWETGTAFSFKAGLSGYEKVFVYDVERRQLYEGRVPSDDYSAYLKERVARNEARAIGESRQGRVEVVESYYKP